MKKEEIPKLSIEKIKESLRSLKNKIDIDEDRIRRGISALMDQVVVEQEKRNTVDALSCLIWDRLEILTIHSNNLMNCLREVENLKKYLEDLI